MKRSAVAAALFAGFVFAAPISAYSQSQPAPGQPQNGAAIGDRTGPSGMGPQGMSPQGMSSQGMSSQGMGMMGMGMRGAGRDDDADEGGMGWRRHWMHERMHRRMHDRSGFGWMGRGMMHRSPAERCQEHVARRMGMIAYTVTKLDLTDAQRSLWNRVNAVLQEGARRELALCGSLPSPEQRAEATILDRLGHAEQFLSTRLQMLQQLRPVLVPFYQSLNPQQKEIADHAFRRR